MAKTLGHQTRKNKVLNTQTRTRTHTYTLLNIYILGSGLMQVAKMLHMSVVCPQ